MIDRDALWREYTERFTSRGAGGPFISASNAGALLEFAAEQASTALGSRDDATRRSNDANLLAEYARRCKDSKERLLILFRVTIHWRADVAAGEALSLAVENMHAMAEQSYNVVRGQWSNAAAKAAGI